MNMTEGTPRELIRDFLRPEKASGKENDKMQTSLPGTPGQIFGASKRKFEKFEVHPVGKTPRNMIKGFLHMKGIARPAVAKTPVIGEKKNVEIQQDGNSLRSNDIFASSSDEEKENTPPEERRSEKQKFLDTNYAVTTNSKQDIAKHEFVESTVEADPKDLLEMIVSKQGIGEQVEGVTSQNLRLSVPDISMGPNNNTECMATNLEGVSVESNKNHVKAVSKNIAAEEKNAQNPQIQLENCTKKRKTKQVIVGGVEEMVNGTSSDIMPTSARTKFPPRTIKRLFTSFLRNNHDITRCSSSVYERLNHLTERFFEQASEDLKAFADHRGKDSIEIVDIECLLRRQRIIHDKKPVEVLIQKFLTREYSDELLSLPKLQRHLSKEKGKNKGKQYC